MAILKLDHIGISGSPDGQDWLYAVRIVPDGREGRLVYARGLRQGEKDTGRTVDFDPEKGERIACRPYALRITIHDCDATATLYPNGYRLLEHTMWLWASLGNPLDPSLFRYLIAASRRLDVANDLLLEIHRARATEVDGDYNAQARHARLTQAKAEMLIVALGRAIAMIVGLEKTFSVKAALPAEIAKYAGALHALRNAYEHVEQRAQGLVFKKPDPDALTIFEQDEFEEHGALKYANHRLTLDRELTSMVLVARNYLFAVAVECAGDARDCTPSLEFYND